MTDFTKQFNDTAEKMKQLVPQVSFNKNGYEIRAQMLEMAQTQVWQDYHAKWGAFETSTTKEGDEIVTKVAMPEVPGADKVVETAEKFYAFVSGTKPKE